MFSIILNVVGSLMHFYVAHRLYRVAPIRSRIPAKAWWLGALLLWIVHLAGVQLGDEALDWRWWPGQFSMTWLGILFVISHSIGEQRYLIHTVPLNAETFDARADLPEPWAGLRDADLAAVTGVPDATFCHNGRFIAAAKSFDGIRALAQQALQAVEEAPAASQD